MNYSAAELIGHRNISLSVTPAPLPPQSFPHSDSVYWFLFPPTYAGLTKDFVSNPSPLSANFKHQLLTHCVLDCCWWCTYLRWIRYDTNYPANAIPGSSSDGFSFYQSSFSMYTEQEFGILIGKWAFSKNQSSLLWIKCPHNSSRHFLT